MKVKIVCRKENYQLYVEMLEKAGFTISQDATLTLREEDFERETLLGKYNDSYELIPYQDIQYVASYGHAVFCYTHDKEYLINEKLFEIEGIFENKGFIRINKSTVVNKKQIKLIKPKLNTRFLLEMKNGTELYVTRSYYYKFREFIGF